MQDYLKSIFAPKYRKLSLAFLLYMYYYLTAELSFTAQAGAAYGESVGTVFYGLYCLAAAAGFFAFGLTRPALKTTGGRRRVFLALGVIGTAATLLAPFVTDWLVGAVSLSAMLIAGYIGAAILHSMAISIQEKSILGMFIALPYAGAFAVQYLLGYIEPLFGSALMTVRHISLAVSLAVCVYLMLIHSAVTPDENAPRIAEKADAKRYLWGALTACLIISCLYGLTDGIIMNLHAGQNLNVYGWVRLLCIPGLLFAAWVADFKEGRYFPFATLLGMLAAALGVFLFNTAETYNAALGSIYFFGSFMTMYSLCVFVRVAGDTDKPGLWAAAGRGVKYAAGGVFSLAGSFLFSHMSLIVIVAAYILLLITLACVFYFRGHLHAAPPQTGTAAPVPKIPTLDELILHYGFTEREAELLKLLLDGQSNAEAAGRMFVTEGTVYKYVSSMMTKTDTKSRFEMKETFKSARR